MDINAHTATISSWHRARVLPVNSGIPVLPQDTPQSTRVMPVQDAWNPAARGPQIDPAIVHGYAAHRQPAASPAVTRFCPTHRLKRWGNRNRQTCQHPAANRTGHSSAAQPERWPLRCCGSRRIRPDVQPGELLGQTRPRVLMAIRGRMAVCSRHGRPDRGRAAGLVARHH